MATLYPEGCSYPYHRGMITPNPFSFRNIYSAIIAWLSHRLRIFSDFNIKAAFCQFFNNGFHLPFFIKIVFICCEKYKSQHIFITFYNIVLTVKTPFIYEFFSRSDILYIPAFLSFIYTAAFNAPTAKTVLERAE